MKKAKIKLIPWKCPRCGADADEHGKGGYEKCKDSIGGGERSCQGLLCECDESGGGDDHGQTFDDPCPNAVCHHCTWDGTMPAEKREDAVLLLREVMKVWHCTESSNLLDRIKKRVKQG